MNKIYAIIAIAACIGILLTGFSKAQIESSVSFPFSGVVQQNPTPTSTPTPTPIPPDAYTYIMRVSGSNYQMTDGTTGQIKYQSTNAAQVINNAIGNLTQGQNILFNAGTYYLTRSIVDAGKDNIGLYFDNGAKIFVSNNMNNPAISLTSVNGWTIKDVTIDGNAANQANAVGNAGATLGEEGIYVNIGSNHHITGAHITNVGQVGVMIVNFDAGHPSIGNKIENSIITNFGWNGITFYGPYIRNSFAINNEIAFGSDVGISTYGANDIIINNYIHDMNGSKGYNNAHWGIGIEDGSNPAATPNNDTIKGNTLYNCGTGIMAGVGSNAFILDNNISASSSYSSSWGVYGIILQTPYNTVKNNQIVGSGWVGMVFFSANHNTIENNTVSGYGRVGIYLDSTSNTNAINLNRVSNTQQGTFQGSHAGAAIDVFGSYNNLGQNQLFDDRSGTSRTQNYGIVIESGATGNILTENNAYNNVISNIPFDLGTSTVINS